MIPYEMLVYKDYLKKLDSEKLCAEVKTITLQMHKTESTDASRMMSACFLEAGNRGDYSAFTAGHGKAMEQLIRDEVQLLELERLERRTV